MNRSEALAPLKAGEGRVPVTAGVVIRGQLRLLRRERLA